MCPEDPPLLRGVVLYTLMCISAKVAIVGKNTYKRSDKCVKMITVFEPIPLPAFPDAFFLKIACVGFVVSERGRLI